MLERLHMNKGEAAALLRDHLHTYRQITYGEIVGLIGKPQVAEVQRLSGATYQVEVTVYWDDLPGGAVRVLGAIDDGGWRAFKPLCDDFIMESDGTLLESRQRH